MKGKYKRPSSKSSERLKLISILKDELRKKTFDLAKSLESSGSGYRVLDDNKNTAPAISALWRISPKISIEASKLFSDNSFNNSKLAKYTNNESFGKCKKCGCNQTITHILTECSIKENLDTNDPGNVITNRHNCIIDYLVKECKENLADKDTQIYVDLPQHENRYKEFPSDLLLKNTTLRPDIIIKSKDLVVVGELTSPME